MTNNSTGRHLVFVYGTLKGNINGDLIAEDAETIDTYCMFNYGFPAVSEAAHGDNEAAKVTGEIWLVDNDEFLRLERYEGAPEFYEARYTGVRDCKTGGTMVAMMYFGKGVFDSDWRFKHTPDDTGRLTWSCTGQLT